MHFAIAIWELVFALFVCAFKHGLRSVISREVGSRIINIWQRSTSVGHVSAAYRHQYSMAPCPLPTSLPSWVSLRGSWHQRSSETQQSRFHMFRHALFKILHQGGVSSLHVEACFDTCMCASLSNEHALSILHLSMHVCAIHLQFQVDEPLTYASVVLSVCPVSVSWALSNM